MLRTDFIYGEQFLHGFVAIVSNEDDDRYLLIADDFGEVIRDWFGECEYVPSNDAKVYFAMNKGKVVGQNKLSDFESLLTDMMWKKNHFAN